jgi:hypothetical protein
MDQDEDMRKKVNVVKEEISTEDPITQEVIVELIEITQLGILMHLRIQRAVQKCLLLGTKEEDIRWMICKDILGTLREHYLMVKEKGKMMLNPSFLESESIFNCTITHLT